MNDSGPDDMERPAEDIRQFKGAVERIRPTEFAISDKIRVQESKSGIAHRRAAMRFLFWVYGPAVAATFTIIFLQGFHAWGFNLSETFLQWLGGAMIGELGILAGVVYASLFPNGGANSGSTTEDKDQTSK